MFIVHSITLQSTECVTQYYNHKKKLFNRSTPLSQWDMHELGCAIVFKSMR